jgi:hypothetical protein
MFRAHHKDRCSAALPFGQAVAELGPFRFSWKRRGPFLVRRTHCGGDAHAVLRAGILRLQELGANGSA